MTVPVLMRRVSGYDDVKAILELRDHPEQADKLREAGKERLAAMHKTWPQIAKELLSATKSILDHF